MAKMRAPTESAIKADLASSLAALGVHVIDSKEEILRFITETAVKRKRAVSVDEVRRHVAGMMSAGQMSHALRDLYQAEKVFRVKVGFYVPRVK